MLSVDILTLFPRMIEGFLEESMIGRACANRLLKVTTHNLRDWATGKHHITDDRPYGGGPGMLLKPEPVFAAVESLKTSNSKVIYMCPDGDMLSAPVAASLAQESHIILISGHYEGIDQRIRDQLVDQEISIGTYVLTNGTLPAAVIVDCVARHIKGVLGEELSLTNDCFTNNLLSFPQYTRPAVFRGQTVPEVLLSGDHQAIAQWRLEQQQRKTRERLSPQ